MRIKSEEHPRGSRQTAMERACFEIDRFSVALVCASKVSVRNMLRNVGRGERGRGVWTESSEHC